MRREQQTVHGCREVRHASGAQHRIVNASWCCPSNRLLKATWCTHQNGRRPETKPASRLAAAALPASRRRHLGCNDGRGGDFGPAWTPAKGLDDSTFSRRGAFKSKLRREAATHARDGGMHTEVYPVRGRQEGEAGGGAPRGMRAAASLAMRSANEMSATWSRSSGALP